MRGEAVVTAADGQVVQGVSAQLAFESKLSKRFIIFYSQGLRSRRFQCGFRRVNLHRPTKVKPTSEHVESGGQSWQVRL